MKQAFMSLKFHDGEEDKKKIDELTEALAKAGIENVVMARDVEKYGKAVGPPRQSRIAPRSFSGHHPAGNTGILASRLFGFHGRSRPCSELIPKS